MEFTPELIAFQGIIISTDNVHPFAKIKARGGNEEKIKYVIKSILSFLKKENYVTETGIVPGKEHFMRNFAMYLILNADIPILKDMVDMEGVSMVIWTIPTISKCLLSEMLWKFHMIKFVREVIALSCPQLALEVHSLLIDSIKYLTPTTCMEELGAISSACHLFIVRLHCFPADQKIMSQILPLALNNLQKCLNYFTSLPNADKLNSLSQDRLYKNKGYCLYTMLSVVHKAINGTSVMQAFKSDDTGNIHLPKFEVDLSIDLSITLTPSSTIPKSKKDMLDCLDKVCITLLDKLQELVMNISVDIFCAWSEFEEDGMSIQRLIGELCYKLREQLLTFNSYSEHPVVSMLQQISCKPVSFEDIINETDSDTIIENINANRNREEWIRALIHRDRLFHDVQLVEHLASNLDVLNNEQCYTLYNGCQNYLKDHSENTEKVELLATNLFQYCSSNAKHEILEERFTNNCFFDMTETAEFSDTMTKVFNKLIVSPDSDLSDILNVFIQNPQKVYTKIFLLASENGQQTEIMLQVMKLLEKYSNHYYSNETEPTMIANVKNILDRHLDTETGQQNFVKFLSGLKHADIISGAKLLLLIVMPHLYTALLNKDVSSINVQCNLLSEAYTPQELVEYRAPMLAMFAQVLEIVRWKIDTFVTLAPSTLRNLLQLQTSLFDTYNTGIPDNEANWLRNKLRNMQPMNLYYYRGLWNKGDSSFIEYVSGMRINTDTEAEHLASWLSLVICSATQKEWCEIWDNLTFYGDIKTLDLLHDVLTLVTETEGRNRTDASWGCLLNCYRNFVFTMRYKFFKEPLTDEQASVAINKIASLANLIQEENIEDVGTVFMPLIAYTVERKTDYTIDVPQLMKNTLKDSKFADMVSKIFTNGTA